MPYIIQQITMYISLNINQLLFT